MKKIYLLKPAIALVLFFVFFAIGSLKAQGPWLNSSGSRCPSDAFLSKQLNPPTNILTGLNSVDLLRGNSSVLLNGAALLPSNQVNGIGYNTKDGYIWGSKIGTGDIVRIGNNGAVTSFTITGTGWNNNNGYNAGDVSPDGKLYLSNIKERAFRVVDLNSASPSTLTSVGTNIGTLWSTPTLVSGSYQATLIFYDFAFNPVDGQIYAVSGGTQGDFGLFRINPTTGNVTQLTERGYPCATCIQLKEYKSDGTLIDARTSVYSNGTRPVADFQFRFGAAYFDPDGNFYIADNAQSDGGQYATNGRVYRFDAVQNYTAVKAARTAVLIGASLTGVDGNDGARCPTAEIPCTVPLAKPLPLTGVCPTGTTFNLTALNPAPIDFTIYEWWTTSTRTTGTQVTNAFAAPAPGTYFLFARRVGSKCYSPASDPVTLTSQATGPTLTATSGQICFGATFNLTTLVNPPTPPTGTTYEWWTTTTRTTGTQVATPTAVGAGTYYAFIKNTSSGCYSAVSSAVTITSAAAVSTPTPTTTAGTICSPATTFNLTTIQPSAVTGVTYEWWTTNTRTAGTQVAALTTAAAGTYYLFARNNTLGCYSSPSSLVTITTAPKPVPTAFTLGGCGSVSLTSLQPAAITNYTFEWHTAATVGATTLVTNPSVVTTSGTYYLYARRTGSSPACYGPASDPVTVTVTPGPTTPVPTATTGDICNPATSFDLTTLQPAAQSGFTYEWWTTTTRSTGTQVSNPSAAGAGVYYLFIRNTSDGCYSNASVAVTISALTAAPTRTTDLLCSTSSTYNLTTIQPSAVTGVTYEWWTTSTRSAGTQVANPAAVSAGVYYFFASKGTNCYTAPTTVTIIGKPAPTALTASNTCPSSSTVNLTLLQPAAISGYTYEWYLKSNNTLVTTPTAVATTGTYYLVLRSNTTTTCASQASDDVLVTITECPLACAEDQTYIFSTVSGTTRTAIYRISPCTGVMSSELKRLTYETSSAAFNPVTNYIWAVKNTGGANSLVRFDAALSETVFNVTNSSNQNLPATLFNLSDFDSSGKMYLAAENSSTMYVIDLNPSSAGYLKYTTVTLSQSTGIFKDWAMNPVDGNLYTVNNSASPVGLFRITTTGTITQIGTIATGTTSQANGAQYFDNAGNFWFLQNNSLGVWRVPNVSTFTAGTTARSATQVSIRTNITLANPDGARCNTAPLCGSDCPTTLSIPSTGNICAPSTTFNLTAIQPTVPTGFVLEWWTTSTRTAGTQVSTPSAVAGGTYHLFAKSSSGIYCTTTSSIVVAAAVAKPTPISFGPLVNSCPVTTVNLTAIQPAAVTGQTYEWHTASTVGSNTLVTTPSAVSVTGDYYLFLKRNNTTCYGPASNPVTVSLLACNQPPTAFPNAYTTPEDTPISGNVISDPNSSGQKDTDPEGNPLSVSQFTVTGVTGTFTAGQTATIPNVGTLQINANGSFTFTPVPNYNGPVPEASYTVSDGNGGTSQAATLTLNVTPVNDPPNPVNDTNTTPEDTPVNGNLLTNDTDPEGNALTVSQFSIDGTTYAAGTTATIPGKGTIVVNSDGSYTFTPAPNFNGAVPTISYTVSETATGLTATADLNINITPVNEPPVALNDQATVAEDTPATGTVLSNDSDLDGDPITVSGFTVNGATITPGQTATLPGVGTLVINSNGTYTFTPAPNFNGTVPPIPYTVSDGKGGTATANLNITVTPVNDPPVANNDTKTTNEDTPLSGNLITPLATPAGDVADTDPDGTAPTLTAFQINGQSYAAGTLATILGVGTIQVNANGSYTFTPASNYNGTVPTITYTVRDVEGLTDTADLNITVTPVNDPPTPVDDSEDTPVNTSVSGELISPNDSDIDNATADLIVWNIRTVNGNFAVNAGANTVQNVYADNCKTANCPFVGTISVSSTGAFTFTPNSTFSGAIEPIYYRIKDPGGLSSSEAILSITVSPENTTPVARPDVATTNEDFPINGNLITGSVVNSSGNFVNTNNSADSDVNNDVLRIQSFKIGTTTYEPGTTASISGVGTLVINADGSWTFTPALNYNGPVPVATYILADNVADGTDGTASSTLTITIIPVNDAPTALNDLNTTNEDTPVSANVLSNDSDVEGNTLSVTGFKIGSTTYPAGTTATIAGVGTIVINSDGSYTFTPAANFNGAVPSVEYTVADGNGGTATANLDIVVTPVNDNPVAVADTKTTPEDTPVSGTVLANDTDSDGDPLSVTQFTVNGQTYLAGTTATISGVGTLKLNADGTYTFTPEKDYNGTVPVATYAVSDGNGGTASATLSITVTPVNDPPVALNDQATIDEDTPATGTVLSNDLDLDGDPITVSGFIVNGATVTPGQTATIAGVGDIVINSDGTYTFTPLPNFNGTVPPIPYTISDGNGGTATATLTITIKPVADNPIAVADTKTTPEDTPASGTVLANDSDGDGDPLSVTQFTVNGQTYLAGTTATISGVGTLKLNADGTYTFTPEKDYNGTVPVATYEVSDGNGGTASATLSITVTPVNDPPVALNDQATIDEDTPATGTVLSNDSDLDGDPITVSGFTVNGATVTPGQTATIAGVGDIVINSDGTYTFTPAPNFNGTVPPIPYTISDGKGGTATANLNITVRPINDLPIAADDTKTTPEDTPVSGTVLANDSDVDGDPLSVTEFEVNGQTYAPGSTATINGVGTLKLNADGTYTFTPEKDYNGPVPSITYTISDGKGGTDSAELTIAITPVNDPPVAGNDTEDTPIDTPVSGTLFANDRDIDGNTFTVSGVSLDGINFVSPGTELTFTQGKIRVNPDGTYTFTPAVGFSGIVPPIYYKITDSDNLSSNAARLDLLVSSENTPPVAVDDAKTTNEDVPVSGNVITDPNGSGVRDTDPDNDPLVILDFSINNVTYPAGTLVPIVGVGSIVINADGSWTFTPALSYNGPVPVVTYTLADNPIDGVDGTDTATLTITITPQNDRPVALNDSNTTPEDTPVSGNVLSNDSDVEGDTLSVTGFKIGGTTYPAGTTATIPGVGTILLNTDGSYNFTPEANFNGNVPSIEYTLSDGNPGGTATAKLDIVVTPVNDAPLANPNAYTGYENSNLTGNIIKDLNAANAIDSDPDNDVLTVTDFKINNVIYPAGSTATLLGIGTLKVNADGSFEFVPVKDYTGPVPQAIYSISDGKGGTANATLDINIRGNEPPVAYPNVYSTPEDTPVSGNIITDVNGANEKDTDPTNDFLIVTEFKINNIVYPVGATAAIIEGIGTLQVNQDGSFTFTPALNYSGPVPQVTYTISDVKGGLSSSTLDITIIPANDAPVATDDTGVVKANTPLTGTVILNDSDPEGSPITVTQFTVAGLVGTFTAGQTATIPNVGTLVINANGTFTFTPVLNYSGPVPVATYTISDGSATDTATLTLKINSPLEAVNDTGVVIEDTPLKGTVILNDSDADSDPIKVTQFTVDGLSETFTAGQTATIPLVGTLVINTDGSFIFTPFSNYTGPIPVVTYGISDGTDTDTATLTLTITPVNYPPVAKDDVDFVTEDTPLNGTVFTNDSDLDGNNTISISEFKVAGVTGTFTAGQTATIPNVGTLVINTDGSFTFTPVANYTGPIPVVTYTISDGTSTDTATLTLTITPVNDNPVAVADTKTTPEDTPVSGTVLTNDSDVDGDPLAVTQFTVNGQTYLAGSTATINGVGTLNINADGTYTFTPEKDYDGPVPVATYEVSDGNGGTATATLTITIIPVKDIEANIDNFQNNEVNGLTGGSAGNVLTNDKVDGKPVNASELVITVKDDGGMKGVTIDALGNLNVPKGTPPGTYIIQYTICDVLVPTNCDDAIAIVEVFHGVDLAINKRAEETKLWEGDEFTYILIVGNVGGTDASEVVVIDNLPAGLTFKSAQLVGTSGLQLSTVVEGQKVTMKLPTLKAGQVVEIKLNVKARPLSGSNTETILNTASVASKETELKTTDNTSSTAVQIQPFFIPNVITPNGDRKNDEFVIKGLGKFNSNEIVIFNRYGDHIFQKKGYENDWSGKGLVAGTYFYILSVVDINGNPTEFKGWIQLIRE